MVGTLVRAVRLGAATADGSIRGGGAHGTHCRLLPARLEPDRLSRDARARATAMRVTEAAGRTAYSRAGLRHSVGSAAVNAGAGDAEALWNALRCAVHRLRTPARCAVGQRCGPP